MPANTIEQLYEQHIKPLPIADQLRLVALIAKNLADQLARPDPAGAGRRSIMELHGLGAEIWADIEAQAYVDELRKEWDHQPSQVNASRRA